MPPPQPASSTTVRIAPPPHRIFVWIGLLLTVFLGLAAWAMTAADRTRSLETHTLRALSELHRMRHATRALLSERDALPALAARWGNALDRFDDGLRQLVRQTDDSHLARLEGRWQKILDAVAPGRADLAQFVTSPLARQVGDEGIEQTVVRMLSDPSASAALRTLRRIQGSLDACDHALAIFARDIEDTARHLGDQAALATRRALLYAALLVLAAAAVGAALLVRITLLNLDLQRANGNLGAARRESERREALLRAVLDTLDEGVVLVDGGGLIRWSNPAAQRLATTATSLQPGQPWQGRIDLRDDANHPIATLSGTFDQRWYDVRALRPAGELRLDVAALPMQLPDGSMGHLVVLVDRTTRRTLEGQLRQAQALETLGRLAGGVAHDFNNLLAGILGNAELLGSKLRDQPQLRARVDTIITAGSRAATLTRQLLDSARRSAMQRGPVEMHALIRDTVSLLERSLDRRIRLITELSATASWIDGDAALLQNALTNLALNSRDAMPDGGELRLTTRTTGPGGQGGDGWFELVVADQGCGIPDAHLQRIFEPFFTTKAVGKGTGLGLAAVHGTITRLGGTITVASRLGEGTRFTIRLPCCQQPASGRRPSVALTTPRPGAARRILLAEDEDLVRTVTCEQLRDLGFVVHSVANGADAVAWMHANSRSCDAAIVDVVMPRMGGIETHRELRRLQPTLPILIWSGYSGGHDIDPLLADGRTAFITKPVTRHGLAEALDRLLRTS